MKVAVIGSRGAPESAERLILHYLPAHTTEVVSGGAVGIDRLAERVASSLGIPVRVFLPDYDTYGRRAPLERNEKIIAYADEVLAFWDGVSRGTGYTITACIRAGKPVRIIPLTGGTDDGYPGW